MSYNLLSIENSVKDKKGRGRKHRKWEGKDEIGRKASSQPPTNKSPDRVWWLVIVTLIADQPHKLPTPRLIKNARAF